MAGRQFASALQQVENGLWIHLLGEYFISTIRLIFSALRFLHLSRSASIVLLVKHPHSFILLLQIPSPPRYTLTVTVIPYRSCIYTLDQNAFLKPVPSQRMRPTRFRWVLPQR